MPDTAIEATVRAFALAKIDCRLEFPVAMLRVQDVCTARSRKSIFGKSERSVRGVIGDPGLDAIELDESSAASPRHHRATIIAS
jgi:hypothetical protein